MILSPHGSGGVQKLGSPTSSPRPAQNVGQPLVGDLGKKEKKIMTKTIGITRVIVLAVVALAVGFIQSANGQVSAKTQKRSSFFTATQIFSLGAGQQARFCVGSRRPGGVPLHWTVPISNDRGVLLFELPETRSPAGDRRCVIVPRSALRISGHSTSSRVQVSARQLVKAPFGTRSSDIVGSFEIVNGDGTIGRPLTGVLYATFHDND